MLLKSEQGKRRIKLAPQPYRTPQLNLIVEAEAMFDHSLNRLAEKKSL